MRYDLKRVSVVVGVLALALTLTACKKVGTQQGPAANQNQPGQQAAQTDDKERMEKEAMATATLYSLASQNNSGETGTVKIFDVDGKAKVVLTVTGAPAGVEQPAHIHEGTCAKLGPVVFGLTNVVNGASETSFTVPLSAIFNGSQRAVNVHKSQAEIGTYVACVDLPSTNTTRDQNVNGNTNDDENDDRNENENSNVNTNLNANANVNLNVNANVNLSPSVKTFNLTARNFSFSQNEIRVKKGDMVKINLNVVEGFHDWVVDEFNGATQRAGSGASTAVQFVANKTGTFEYYCSVGSHRAMGMKGKLIVE